jgi:hypothetical protein
LGGLHSAVGGTGGSLDVELGREPASSAVFLLVPSILSHSRVGSRLANGMRLASRAHSAWTIRSIGFNSYEQVGEGVSDSGKVTSVLRWASPTANTNPWLVLPVGSRAQVLANTFNQVATVPGDCRKKPGPVGR